MKIFSWGDDRERYLLWEEFNGIYVVVTTCLEDLNIVVSVVVHGRINVPSICDVGRICASLFGLEMYCGFCAWWIKWGSVGIRCAKAVCVGVN